MDDFENIKELWNSQQTMDIPSTKEIQTVIKNFQAKKKRNAFLTTVLFIACAIFILIIIIFHKPLIWATTFGEVLMIIGFLSGIVLKFRMLRNLTNDELISNRDFLENVLTKSEQKSSRTNWHIIISALLLAVGYGFFIYEEIRDNLFQMILTYLGIALFSLFMIFIFRPYVKRISKNKVRNMLERLGH